MFYALIVAFWVEGEGIALAEEPVIFTTRAECEFYQQKIALNFLTEDNGRYITDGKLKVLCIEAKLWGIEG